MNEQNVGSEGTATPSKERGPSGMAAKSRETAERLEHDIAEQAARVRDKADTAREHVAERFRRVASHLRNVGDDLRSDDQMASMLAERACRGMDGVADYIASTDLRGVVRDTERLARRQPAAFFGGAFVIGLALGRFLKNAPPAPADAGWRASSGETEATSAARDEPRRSPAPPPDQTNQQRYRENYDATFARDIPSSPAGASPAQGAREANPRPRSSEPSPESNGGRRSARGKTS